MHLAGVARAGATRFAAGHIIGDFEILSLLGAGGMAEVYKAFDMRLQRNVAIKLLRRDSVSYDDRIRRFLIEAQAACALNHPNVCTIYSVEEHGAEQFIVMEYIDGTTLRSLATDSCLPSVTSSE